MRADALVGIVLRRRPGGSMPVHALVHEIIFKPDGAAGLIGKEIADIEETAATGAGEARGRHQKNRRDKSGATQGARGREREERHCSLINKKIQGGALAFQSERAARRMTPARPGQSSDDGRPARGLRAMRIARGRAIARKRKSARYVRLQQGKLSTRRREQGLRDSG